MKKAILLFSSVLTLSLIGAEVEIVTSKNTDKNVLKVNQGEAYGVAGFVKGDSGSYDLYITRQSKSNLHEGGKKPKIEYLNSSKTFETATSADGLKAYKNITLSPANSVEQFMIESEASSLAKGYGLYVYTVGIKNSSGNFEDIAKKAIIIK